MAYCAPCGSSLILSMCCSKIGLFGFHIKKFVMFLFYFYLSRVQFSAIRSCFRCEHVEVRGKIFVNNVCL